MIDLKLINIDKELPSQYRDFSSKGAYPLFDKKCGIIFLNDNFLDLYNGLKQRYSKHNLVPFAISARDDTVCCFSLNDEILKKVYLIQDFQGYENPIFKIFENFDQFLGAILRVNYDEK